MTNAIFDEIKRGVQLTGAMVTNYSLTSQRDAVQNVFGSVVHTVCLSVVDVSIVKDSFTLSTIIL
jgi:hypothetical protein